jgi:uncharacterized Zn-binding protein involved in type VI secretion
MPNIALHGDTVSHGGILVSGAVKSKNKGKLIVRQGDPAVCSIHGPQTVAQGSIKLKVEGKNAALNGMTLTCGATIIASGDIQVN